jgi:hypothetical protein
MRKTRILEILNARRNGTTLFAYYAMSALVALAGAIFTVQGDWASAGSTILIFMLMFFPAHLRERHRLYLPFTLDLGIVGFIFITLFLGHIQRFYDHVPFWDKFVHFQSGLLLGATGYIIIYLLNEQRTSRLDLTPGFVSVFAIIFSLAIGAIWEMLEFAADYALSIHWQDGLSDTMWDLIVNAIGAVIISVFGYFWMHHHKRLPLTPRLLTLFKRVGKRGQ